MAVFDLEAWSYHDPNASTEPDAPLEPEAVLDGVLVSVWSSSD